MLDCTMYWILGRYILWYAGKFQLFQLFQLKMGTHYKSVSNFNIYIYIFKYISNCAKIFLQCVIYF